MKVKQTLKNMLMWLSVSGLDVAEGAVFKKWGIVKEFPRECKKVGIGQDFGFTNDPSAAVRCGIIDNRLYVDELFYETDMLSSLLPIG